MRFAPTDSVLSKSCIFAAEIKILKAAGLKIFLFNPVFKSVY